VHRLVEVRIGNVDIAAAGIEGTLGRHESISGRMGLQAPDVEVHLFGQPETITADLNEVTGRDEGLDVALERRPVVLRDFEDLEQLAHAGGMMDPFPHEGEDLIV